MKLVDTGIGPIGNLTLQIVAMPRDTNPNGDIYAGWLMEQMDLAGAMAASQVSKGRTTTVAMDRVEFLSPVAVGDRVSCFTHLVDTGRSSIKILVEVYVTDSLWSQSNKVTETTFIYVAINEMGGIRQLPALD
ncbi:MAG: acyl-CoA thioesterase YciA [Oleiphilaceae bacterium]|jgi:acyl-CoA thioesterase YciA